MLNNDKEKVDTSQRLDFLSLDPGTTVEVATDNSTYWITTLRTTERVRDSEMVIGVSIMTREGTVIRSRPTSVSVAKEIVVGGILRIFLFNYGANQDEVEIYDTSTIKSIIILQQNDPHPRA